MHDYLYNFILLSIFHFLQNYICSLLINPKVYKLIIIYQYTIAVVHVHMSVFKNNSAVTVKLYSYECVIYIDS